MTSIEQRLSRLEASQKPKQDGNYISILPEAEETMRKCWAACPDEHDFYRCVGSAHAMLITEREEKNLKVNGNIIDTEIAERAVKLLSDRGILCSASIHAIHANERCRGMP